MNLSAPKQVTFIVAAIPAIVGLLGSLIAIPVISPLAFWLVLVGFVVLALGNLVDGL